MNKIPLTIKLADVFDNFKTLLYCCFLTFFTTIFLMYFGEFKNDEYWGVLYQNDLIGLEFNLSGVKYPSTYLDEFRIYFDNFFKADIAIALSFVFYVLMFFLSNIFTVKIE